MGLLGDIVSAPFKAAKTLITAPLNIIGETVKGAFKGGFSWGKVGLALGAVAGVALAIPTGGASLAVTAGALASGAAIGAGVGAITAGAAGAVVGAGGGALHSTGESLSNLAQLNGKKGFADGDEQAAAAQQSGGGASGGGELPEGTGFSEEHLRTLGY